MKNVCSRHVIGPLSWAGLLLFSAMSHAHAEHYVARTAIHVRCVFPDQSYTEYKEREKWFPKAELTAHGQSVAYLDAKKFYVDTAGKRHADVGTSDPDCAGVGKPQGRIFWDNGFEDFQHRFIEWSLEPNKPGDNAPQLAMLPAQFQKVVDQRPDLLEIKEREHLFAQSERPVIALGPQTLLFEQAMTALKHPTVPFDTVLYVYQSISSDYGKTWSTPVLTRDAKLYEIGRLISRQSWSPEVVTIVRHR